MSLLSVRVGHEVWAVLSAVDGDAESTAASVLTVWAIAMRQTTPSPKSPSLIRRIRAGRSASRLRRKVGRSGSGSTAAEIINKPRRPKRVKGL